MASTVSGATVVASTGARVMTTVLVSHGFEVEVEVSLDVGCTDDSANRCENCGLEHLFLIIKK